MSMVVGRIVFYNDAGVPQSSRPAVSADLSCSKSVHIFVKGSKRCFCGWKVTDEAQDVRTSTD
jgi:hypothetical protein